MSLDPLYSLSKGNAGMCAYSMSKAAVIGLVKSVGKEYAETGITVNALAPAVVRTEMVENMNPQQVKQLTDKIPAKRQVHTRRCRFNDPHPNGVLNFSDAAPLRK